MEMSGTTTPDSRPGTTPGTGPAPTPGRDIVVFHVWQSLPYPARLALSLILIAVGLVLQTLALYYGYNRVTSFVAGMPLLFAGNIFLLVKGYDNRVDVKSFDPSVSWEVVKREKLSQLKELDKKISKWDRSAMDITSKLGFTVLLFVIGGTVAAAWLAPVYLAVLVLDGAWLAVPHWFTGTRRTLRLPKLLVKVNAMEELLAAAEPQIRNHELEIMMLLKGKKIPDDVKFRLKFKQQDPRFLGLYGQVVTNDVQGRSYPYFYTVMVAKKGYGLDRAFNDYNPPAGVTKEFGAEDEVEFVVVRQHTTKTSGYHTNAGAAAAIFFQGFGLAQKWANVTV